MDDNIGLEQEVVERTDSLMEFYKDDKSSRQIIYRLLNNWSNRPKDIGTVEYFSKYVAKKPVEDVAIVLENMSRALLVLKDPLPDPLYSLNRLQNIRLIMLNVAKDPFFPETIH